MKAGLPFTKKRTRTHVICAMFVVAFVASVLQISTFQYKYNLLLQSSHQDEADLPTRKTASSKTAKIARRRDVSIIDQSPPTLLAKRILSPSNNDRNGEGEQLLSRTGKQKEKIAALFDGDALVRSPIAGSPNQSSQTILADNKLASTILNGKESLPLVSETKDIKFSPGSLDLEATQVLRHCYVNTTVYKRHFEHGAAKQVFVSEEHKLIFKFLRKSGSSTGRFLMQRRFGAKDKIINNEQLATPRWANYTVFTVVRDPLSRFFSSYEEAFLRTGPWSMNGNEKHKGFSHPVPYLFEGIKTMADFVDIYCPPETRNNTGKQLCDYQPTQENGTLAARFERYVRETDGLSPFEHHLDLQTPILSSYVTGLPFRMDEIYNVATAAEAWDSIGESSGVNISEPIIIQEGNENQTSVGVIHGRSVLRKLDMSRISNATKQRICEFGLLDYCCLNMPLPPPCENLFCRLKHVSNNSLGKRWLVEPWSFPTFASS